MKITTALNHERRFIQTMREAVCDRRSHDDVLEYVRKHVYYDPAWQKCPCWVRDRVMARHFEHMHCLYRFGLVVWLHFWEGERYESWDKLPEEAREDVMNGHKLESHYVWKSSGVIWI